MGSFRKRQAVSAEKNEQDTGREGRSGRVAVGFLGGLNNQGEGGGKRKL